MFKKKSRNRCVLEALADIGIKNGQTVLDCCCGDGTYTIPAAQLAGNGGDVYALDVNKSKLHDIKRKITSSLISNIKLIHEDAGQSISLPDSSVDIVLLYDIFWYFRPNEGKLSRLLHEIYRIVKPHGIISVLPKHIDSTELREFNNEMERLGFSLIDKLKRELAHDNRIEQGVIHNFKKSSEY